MELNASVTYYRWTPAEDSQGLCLNFIQSVMDCLNFQNTYFRKYLLMVAFIRFRSTCFSKTSKWILSSLSNSAIFYLEYFYLKNHPKKHTLILTSFMRGNSIIAFMFLSLLFMLPLFKNFSLLAKQRFYFFKATLSTLNIIYMKLIYIKSSFGFTFE